MEKTLTSWIFGIVALAVTSLAYADQAEFCAGFTEGYKSIKGDMVTVPTCPTAPTTPTGTTDLWEGILAGIRAAQR